MELSVNICSSKKITQDVQICAKRFRIKCTRMLSHEPFCSKLLSRSDHKQSLILIFQQIINTWIRATWFSINSLQFYGCFIPLSSLTCLRLCSVEFTPRSWQVFHTLFYLIWKVGRLFAASERTQREWSSDYENAIWMFSNIFRSRL